MKYVFGPVPSRRLGMSLGVDIIPFKTCNFDCIYCQLGKTNVKCDQRQAYVPRDEVLKELREVLDKENSRIDFITLSGSGEPMLNSEIGSVIKEIKTFSQVPIAVITNGSLLYRDDVKADLSEADLVVPSLDAVNEDIFVRVNRPHEGLTAELLIKGLVEFTRTFRGKVWLEIMLVKDINDDSDELKNIANLVRDIKLDKIQLNTVVRPPAENVQPVSAEEMLDIRSLFDSRAEIIVDFDKSVEHKTYDKDSAEFIKSQIISLLKRRPCTADDISVSLGINRNQLIKHITELMESGSIKRVKRGGKWYYE